MPVLFSVAPLNADTGLRTTLRFCNADDDRVTGLNGEKWWPGIGRAPALTRQIFDGSFDNGVALAQAATQLHLAALRKHDPDAPLYRFAGAPMEMWSGELGAAWAQYEQVFEGLVTSFEVEEGVLSLTAQVDSDPFEATFLELKYDGLGGAGGVEDLKDKVKPAVFGHVKNVEPVMINTVDNVFQVHGYGPIQEITMIYERAAAFDAAVADYPTYAALVAADLEEGTWATCLAEGMFRLGAPPFGLITADVKGDNTGGFHESTAEIMLRLCALKAVDSGRINSASIAAFDAAVPYAIGIYLTSPEKLIDILQRLARPCNAQLALSWLGQLEVTRFGSISTSPVLTLDAQGRQKPAVLENAEANVSPPYWRMEMQAERNWRVHSKDEIAFEDDIEIPITAYRRYPMQPDTPEGNGIPAGWFENPQQYTSPVTVNSFPQFGPIWESTAVQTRGVTQGEWSQPVMFDAEWPDWVLVSQNETAKVLGKTRGVKAALDFNPDTDVWPYCFINRPVTGPWVFRCKVRGALDRVAVGVVTYDPATLNGGYDVGDIFDGYYVAQNDTYAVTNSGSPTTGVFAIQDFDPASTFVNGQASRLLNPPVAECDLEMVFNGQTVEHWIDGERVRTHFVNQAVHGSKFWAVFLPLSPGAEIYDIQWGRATQAKSLEFPVDYVEGTLRRTDDDNGWEGYAPEVSNSATVGILESKNFSGGAYAKAKFAGSNGAAIFRFSAATNIGSINLYDDGTFEATRGGSTVVASGTWVDGDEFAMKWDRKKIWYYKNGTKLKEKKVSSPPASASLLIELSHGVEIIDLDLIPKEEGEFALKGSVSDGSLLTPIADTSPTVSGGYIVVAETTDLVYAITTDDTDEVAVTGTILYSKTGGAAASLTPEAKLQYSSNAGGSWTDLGSPATGPASTGSQQQVIVNGQQTISSSAKRRYRLLLKNTVVGDYTADLEGSLLANWNG